MLYRYNLVSILANIFTHYFPTLKQKLVLDGIVCMFVAVKGVNFYGPKSEFIVSGSDCGNVFLWEKQSEKIVTYFNADEGGVVSMISLLVSLLPPHL